MLLSPCDLDMPLLETGHVRIPALIGACSDIGGAVPGAEAGPAALRAAHLMARVLARGGMIEDWGNVDPAFPNADDQDLVLNIAAWCQSVRDRVGDAFDHGRMPVLLGGDHSLSIGSVAASAAMANRLGRPLTVLWIDAHADFNTPDSSPSGNIHGMPVAVLTGHGDTRLTDLCHRQPAVYPSDVVQLGVRSIDGLEAERISRFGLEVHDMTAIRRLGVRRIIDGIVERVARNNGCLHVSFDVDSLDPGIAPAVGVPEPDGLTADQTHDILVRLADSGVMTALDVVELNPSLDEDGRTTALITDLIADTLVRLTHFRLAA